MNTIYEAEIIDPASGNAVTVHALSPVELEAEIDLAFGITTDARGRELAAA